MKKTVENEPDKVQNGVKTSHHAPNESIKAKHPGLTRRGRSGFFRISVTYREAWLEMLQRIRIEYLAAGGRQDTQGVAAKPHPAPAPPPGFAGTAPMAKNGTGSPRPAPGRPGPRAGESGRGKLNRKNIISRKSAPNCTNKASG